jgi:hypothetical protein
VITVQPPAAVIHANLAAAYGRFFSYIVACEYDRADQELELIRDLASALRR